MDLTSDETTENTGGATTISAVHQDIIETHILTRLDGPSLASAATTCSQLHALSSHDPLWSNICYSTWPSTNTPRVKNVISTFPHGYRSFFSDSFATASTAENPSSNPDRTSELISTVDLFLREQPLLSKVVETETVTGWFRCWPFRVDLLDPKDSVQTPINYPIGDDTCHQIGEELRLSWIVIDPTRRRAVNVSSRSPVSVRRHWLTGEMEVLFTTVVESAVCIMTVMCGGRGGRMQVREVSMHMEDMDGKQLNGRDSLGILKIVLEGKRGRLKKEGKDEYVEFEKKKKERKEKKLRREKKLDMLCLVLVTVSFGALSSLFLF
ncbi:hypothetical protein TanjilG_02561 [Lupinus angustifolius]|uniref:F-box domain-containing protein n=1 Tax=Lupinus angustifolius TaxID=3871 RepID=A0A394DED0_LUPAN|nr:PREDICTED: probable F-box protein At1g60180 [Lupinus angustifolius]OIW21394.1 hypothetical protein TanjilG_02561 [Lupinus angustifolius]